VNETQVIFTLFFAISWRIVSNVLPRWKPFHFALCFRRDFWQPTRRFLTAVIMLDLLPWIVFVLVFHWLRGLTLLPDKWTCWNTFLLIPRAILPGLVPFGFYHLWISVIEWWPLAFYAQNQNQVPEPFRSCDGEKRVMIEPDAATLRLGSAGAPKNFCFGFINVCFCLFALIPLSKPSGVAGQTSIPVAHSSIEVPIMETVIKYIGENAELVTAVASVIIVFLAFFTSVWQGIVARRHNRISVKPHLTTWTESKPEEGVYRIELINNGIGPAIIRQFEVKIDGNKVPGVGTQLIESGLKILFPNYTYESYQSYVTDGYVMAKNENRELVRVKFVSDNQPTPDAVKKTFERADLLIEYESMYGEKFSLSTEAARLKAKTKNSKL